MQSQTHPLTRWLEARGATVTALWAAAAAFSAYFAMYAFRKPFSAARFDGEYALGTDVTLKTAFGISQIIGYTISKYLGVKINSELTPARRFVFLLGLIGFAHVALVLFAVLPPAGMLVAIFLNGLPLGMVWGVMVTYLEGRRSSETLLAVLSVSFIVASGVVKDVGLRVMDAGVSEAWMPAAVGLLFLPVFVVAIWMLDRTPAPSEADRVERCERAPMTAADRARFFRTFAPGIIALLVVYFFVTALRDFRDFFQREIVDALGLGDQTAIFTRTEFPIAIAVLAILGALALIRGNRAGLIGAHAIMLAGGVLVGGSTWAFSAGRLSGINWMILNGLGLFMTYVPFGSVLFDRIIAATRFGGTAVFAIYLCDAVGYTGSVALKLFKDLGEADLSHLEFAIGLSYVTAALTVVLLTVSCVFFVRRTYAPASASSP